MWGCVHFACSNENNNTVFIVTDINECGSGVHDCSEYAQCTNIHGGYNCSCPSGYDVDGVNCTGRLCT